MSKPEIFNGLSDFGIFNRAAIGGLTLEGYEHLQLSDLERLKLKRITEVLSHTALTQMANQGEVTLAMIKPASRNHHGVSDVKAEQKIRGEIKKPLESIFSITLMMTGADFEVFYIDQKNILSSLPPVKDDSFINRWEELKAYMSTGPTTFLLLYDSGGNAIKEWREQIGHWNVEKNRDTATLRGRWAPDNSTSILHGSDSTISVKREIAIVRIMLNRLIDK